MTDRFDDGPTPGRPQPPSTPGEPHGPAEPQVPSDAPTPPMGLPRPPAPEPPAGEQPTRELTPTDEPPTVELPVTAEEPPADQPRRGQIRYQDPSTARPRPPSLAEQRARQAAERDEQDRTLAMEADAERKRKLKRRLLIGGGVTVGVVAIVSIWYAASAQADQVTAYCVAGDDVVNQDDNCDENYVRSHG